MGVAPRLALAAAAVALACAAVTPARAATPGVVTDLTWAAPAADTAPTIAAVGDLGVRWVRLSAQWKNVEQVPGVYDAWWLAQLDNAVAAARAAGLTIVFTVYDAPSWATGSSARNAPGNPADFARFMSFIAGRYAGKVAGWEIWNEENIERFWTSPDPAAYAALLKAAYPAVKTADPATKVIFGGVSTSDYAFIEKAYAAGARGSFDVMAVHPYTYCGNTSPDTIRRDGNGRVTRDSFLGYREVHASMLAQGDDKPIWVTEFGWNTSTAVCNPGAGIWQGGVSAATQADYLKQAFSLFASDPYVEVALVYNLRNNYWQADTNTPEAQYGLMQTNFSKKPAYDALRAVAGGAATPPPPPPPPAPAVTVKVTSPTYGAPFNGAVVFAASPTATAGVARVEFRVDGRLVKTQTSGFSFKWGDAKKLMPGTHEFRATAYDRNGSSAADAVYAVRVAR